MTIPCEGGLASGVLRAAVPPRRGWQGSTESGQRAGYELVLGSSFGTQNLSAARGGLFSQHGSVEKHKY